MSNLLTTKELSELFNVTIQTIWRWREQGLPHIKVNSRTMRYDLEEVKKWMESQNGISK